MTSETGAAAGQLGLPAATAATQNFRYDNRTSADSYDALMDVTGVTDSVPGAVKSAYPYSSSDTSSSRSVSSAGSQQYYPRHHHHHGSSANSRYSRSTASSHSLHSRKAKHRQALLFDRAPETSEAVYETLEYVKNVADAKDAAAGQCKLYPAVLQKVTETDWLEGLWQVAEQGVLRADEGVCGAVAALLCQLG